MRCEACPLEAGEPCLGESHPRLCQPKFHRVLVARVAALVKPIVIDPRVVRAETCGHGDGCHCDRSRVCLLGSPPVAVTLTTCLTCSTAGNSPTTV